MNILVYNDYQSLSEKASNIIIEEIKRKPDITLGLATGSTPIGMYNYLVEAYKRKLISFEKVRTFNLDEYIGISDTHSNSYKTYMTNHFFNKIDIGLNNTYLPKNNVESLNENIEEYNKLLNSYPIDIQILGIGENGHIGFNEPGTPFSNETFVVDLDEKTKRANSRFFDASDGVPTRAITMGIKNIMSARKIILLANGKEKSTAVYEAVNGEITNQLPASILQQHPDVTLLLDKDAASKLK